ncbi:MAG: GNAT family N-acetyltransferase [Promethearchaeota archaeon]
MFPNHVHAGSLEILDIDFYKPTEKEILDISRIELDPNVQKWNTAPVFSDSDDFNSFVQRFSEFFDFVREHPEHSCLLGRFGGEMIGFIAIHGINDRPDDEWEVGITVAPRFQSLGFGTCLMKAGIKKAKIQGYKKLIIETKAENLPMRRLALKTGFSFVGIQYLTDESSGTRVKIAVYSLNLESI